MNNNNLLSFPLLGSKAPSFIAKTTKGEINFPIDYEGKWVIFFSHPADFTPVCTTEFMTFQKMYYEFKSLNTELLGLSVDSIYSHIAWLRKIKDLRWNNINNPEIMFPLIEDIKMDIAKKYGMIQPNQSTTEAVRAVFIIDHNGIIRTILYYPLTTGRNFYELKRIIQALQKTDLDNVATPADWQPGDDVIVSAPDTMEEAKKRLLDKNYYCLDWFMCFKKENKNIL